MGDALLTLAQSVLLLSGVAIGVLLIISPVKALTLQSRYWQPPRSWWPIGFAMHTTHCYSGAQLLENFSGDLSVWLWWSSLARARFHYFRRDEELWSSSRVIGNCPPNGVRGHGWIASPPLPRNTAGQMVRRPVIGLTAHNGPYGRFRYRRHSAVSSPAISLCDLRPDRFLLGAGAHCSRISRQRPCGFGPRMDLRRVQQYLQRV